jgi:hypothetical protein
MLTEVNRAIAGIVQGSTSIGKLGAPETTGVALVWEGRIAIVGNDVVDAIRLAPFASEDLARSATAAAAGVLTEAIASRLRTPFAAEHKDNKKSNLKKREREHSAATVEKRMPSIQWAVVASRVTGRVDLSKPSARVVTQPSTSGVDKAHKVPKTKGESSSSSSSSTAPALPEASSATLAQMRQRALWLHERGKLSLDELKALHKACPSMFVGDEPSTRTLRALLSSLGSGALSSLTSSDGLADGAAEMAPPPDRSPPVATPRDSRIVQPIHPSAVADELAVGFAGWGEVLADEDGTGSENVSLTSSAAQGNAKRRKASDSLLEGASDRAAHLEHPNHGDTTTSSSDKSGHLSQLDEREPRATNQWDADFTEQPHFDLPGAESVESEMVPSLSFGRPSLGTGHDRLFTLHEDVHSFGESSEVDSMSLHPRDRSRPSSPQPSSVLQSGIGSGERRPLGPSSGGRDDKPPLTPLMGGSKARAPLQSRITAEEIDWRDDTVGFHPMVDDDIMEALPALSFGDSSSRELSSSRYPDDLS